jgi:hypothetical protein
MYALYALHALYRHSSPTPAHRPDFTSPPRFPPPTPSHTPSHLPCPHFPKSSPKGHTPKALIKPDLRRRLRHRPRILIERPVRLMPLLLDRRPEPEQLIRHGLARRFEDVDQRPRLRLIVIGEQRDGEARGAGSAGSMDPYRQQIPRRGFSEERDGKGWTYRPMRWT